MLVFEGDNKIGLFFWSLIKDLDFKKKKLYLNVTDTEENVSLLPPQYLFSILKLYFMF